MESMNYFGHVVQQIFQNNYLRTSFEKLRNHEFCPHFLNAHISRTVNVRQLNEAILRSSY